MQVYIDLANGKIVIKTALACKAKHSTYLFENREGFSLIV